VFVFSSLCVTPLSERKDSKEDLTFIEEKIPKSGDCLLMSAGLLRHRTRKQAHLATKKEREIALPDIWDDYRQPGKSFPPAIREDKELNKLKADYDTAHNRKDDVECARLEQIIKSKFLEDHLWQVLVDFYYAPRAWMSHTEASTESKIKDTCFIDMSAAQAKTCLLIYKVEKGKGSSADTLILSHEFIPEEPQNIKVVLFYPIEQHYNRLTPTPASLEKLCKRYGIKSPASTLAKQNPEDFLNGLLAEFKSDESLSMETEVADSQFITAAESSLALSHASLNMGKYPEAIDYALTAYDAFSESGVQEITTKQARCLQLFKQALHLQDFIDRQAEKVDSFNQVVGLSLFSKPDQTEANQRLPASLSITLHQDPIDGILFIANLSIIRCDSSTGDAYENIGQARQKNKLNDALAICNLKIADLEKQLEHTASGKIAALLVLFRALKTEMYCNSDLLDGRNRNRKANLESIKTNLELAHSNLKVVSAKFPNATNDIAPWIDLVNFRLAHTYLLLYQNDEKKQDAFFNKSMEALIALKKSNDPQTFELFLTHCTDIADDSDTIYRIIEKMADLNAHGTSGVKKRRVDTSGKDEKKEHSSSDVLQLQFQAITLFQEGRACEDKMFRAMRADKWRTKEHRAGFKVAHEQAIDSYEKAFKLELNLRTQPSGSDSIMGFRLMATLLRQNMISDTVDYGRILKLCESAVKANYGQEFVFFSSCLHLLMFNLRNPFLESPVSEFLEKIIDRLPIYGQAVTIGVMIAFCRFEKADEQPADIYYDFATHLMQEKRYNDAMQFFTAAYILDPRHREKYFEEFMCLISLASSEDSSDLCSLVSDLADNVQTMDNQLKTFGKSITASSNAETITDEEDPELQAALLASALGGEAKAFRPR